MKKNFLFYVAEYVRLSKEDGDKPESDSIGNQRVLIHNFIKDQEELILYDTYIDDGYSGTNFQRPAFQRMLADIKAGNVNCVIVKDLSRFGRDYIDTGHYLERYFPDNNIRFIAITDNIDSLKHTYDMLLPIKNIFNEQYARDISKKIHVSMQTKQCAGEFIGAFSSYGYKKSPSDKNKLIIDEYAADIVRKIFDLYINGTGKIRIAKLLNDQNILCPSEYKKANGENYRNSNRLDSTHYWTYSTIHTILQNQMYIGNMVQGKSIQRMRGKAKYQDREDWIIVKDTHAAVIDPDTWDKAQDLLKRRVRNLDLPANMSIFAGFLKCGDCGRALRKKQNAGGRISYTCGTYVSSGVKYCASHYITQEILERIILSDLNTIVRSREDIYEMIAQNKKSFVMDQFDPNKEITRLIAELEKTKLLKKSSYDHFQDGLITKEEYISYRQSYLAKEDLLTHQLKCLDRKQDNKTDIFKNPWIKRLVKLNSIEKLDRDIIVSMVQEIKVYNNRTIKIIYKFSGEFKNLFHKIYVAK